MVQRVPPSAYVGAALLGLFADAGWRTDAQLRGQARARQVRDDLDADQDQHRSAEHQQPPAPGCPAAAQEVPAGCELGSPRTTARP